jgi:hypothetical protein
MSPLCAFALSPSKQSQQQEPEAMPMYMIQRNISGAGQLDAAALKEIACQSNKVIGGMGPGYAWIRSFLTDDGITCIHVAPSEAAVREHARLGGFPVDSVIEIRGTLDPSAAAS